MATSVVAQAVVLQSHGQPGALWRLGLWHLDELEVNRCTLAVFDLWLDSAKLELALFGAKSRDSASAAQVVRLQGHDFLKCSRGHEFMKDHT